MKFEFYEDKKKEHRWRLKAANGQVSRLRARATRPRPTPRRPSRRSRRPRQGRGRRGEGVTQANPGNHAATAIAVAARVTASRPSCSRRCEMLRQFAVGLGEADDRHDDVVLLHAVGGDAGLQVRDAAERRRRSSPSHFRAPTRTVCVDRESCRRASASGAVPPAPGRAGASGARSSRARRSRPLLRDVGFASPRTSAIRPVRASSRMP